MQIDKYGQVSFNTDEIFNALYSGKLKSDSSIVLDDLKEVELFTKSVNSNADNILKINSYIDPQINLEEFDASNQDNWFMPKEYEDFDIANWLLEQCKNQQESDRVVEELELFYQHNMINLLKYLKYLVDTMRSNKIVWGLGRGSSVASYCLYLLGIHKIDPLKYKLDIREFIK